MADIYVSYGTNYSQMTYQLLEKASVSDDLYNDMKILIKPNMVLASPPSNGATTHSEVVDGIIRYLHDNKVTDITVGESSWVGERNTFKAYDICGFTDLSKKYDIKLKDLKDDDAREVQLDGIIYNVCESIDSYDYIINVPVLKGHSSTRLTCSMKNLKGLIPDKEKRRYHTMGLHHPIAILNTIIKPDLHVIDSICGDLDFEEGGNPVQSDRILIGKDPVLLDSYCARLIGYSPDEIEYLNLARDMKLGEIASGSTSIEETGTENKPSTPGHYNKAVDKLRKMIGEDSACSACYASLIFALHKLNPSCLSDLGLKDKIKIGQGYKGNKLEGFGVGNCTAGCTKYVRGCPPSAKEILDELNKI